MRVVTNKEKLIKEVGEKNLEGKKLVVKIVNQIKLAKKNSKNHLNVDEKKMRNNLEQLIKKWEIKKVGKIIDSFLESIKIGLQNQEEILLWGYFSLKVYSSSGRGVRDQKDGKEIKTKTENKLYFQASKKLKKAIN